MSRERISEMSMSTEPADRAVLVAEDEAVIMNGCNLICLNTSFLKPSFMDTSLSRQIDDR